jgi:cytochrome c peroxidase
LGIHEFTTRQEGVGKFKTPTLRNVALTAPYMHAGNAATLDTVIDHNSAGGRTVVDPAYANEGFHNPNKDTLIQGFILSPQERGSDCISGALDGRWGTP